MAISIDVYDSVFKELKDNIKNSFDYKVYTTKMPIQASDKFPQVVLTEEDNALSLGTTRLEETMSRLSYEINIYTQDKNINGKMISRVEIARNLMKIVDITMANSFKMRRIFCRPTPNIDVNIYRITMRYQVNFFDNKKRII